MATAALLFSLVLLCLSSLCGVLQGVSLSFRVFVLCSFALAFCFGSALSLPSLSPFSLLSLCLPFPSGVVLVFLAADWSGFPAPPCPPFPPFGSLPCPLSSLVNKSSSVVLLAADWSGVSTSLVSHFPSNQRCLWPQTGPGAVAFQH